MLGSLLQSGLTVDVEACSAGHDACVVLGWHSVPASIFFHGWLDDHAQVAAVVLVHAGKEHRHKWLNILRSYLWNKSIWYKCWMKQYSPNSVGVVSEWLVLPFPEYLWVGNPSDATLESHRMTFCNTCVLQLLDEWGGLVHLFGCGETVLMRRIVSAFLHEVPAYLTVYLQQWAPG